MKTLNLIKLFMLVMDIQETKLIGFLWVIFIILIDNFNDKLLLLQWKIVAMN